MPPRLPCPRRLSCSLSSRLSSSSAQPSPFSSPLLLSSSSYSTPSQQLSRFQSTEARSDTTETVPDTPEVIRRRIADSWLNGPGRVFKTPLPGSTNYLSAYDQQGKLIRSRQPESENATKKSDDGKAASAEEPIGEVPPEDREDLKPFPANPAFVSQSVLSEELRNEIYSQVKEKGKSVRAVSVMFGVDMRRVGAVVRLVELEKRWVKEKKPLALPYARAVHQMIPTTPFVKPPRFPSPHEPINDLPVHRLTDPQIFYPVSESRQFTRVDAGRVFSAAPAQTDDATRPAHNTPDSIAQVTHNPGRIEKVGKKDEQVLLPADLRIPHPHLVAYEHDRIHLAQEKKQRSQRFAERLDAEEAADKDRKDRQKQKIADATNRVVSHGGRYEFRFRDAVVSRENTGADGWGTKAPGKRYGVPNYDRKRGAVKIPTRVDV
ncbi:hypothetical protein AJ80_06271 [Polytolypa hystricis UAMH7299]|uniref:Eukaryotic mitochondrial regulator protein-domain-containing protein n=1 Tax=Polytolypa hystricis (strain UAMH7299) TaxID=1447883 RepID=A0A2B7XXM0_POLH7|nr:hypothetical protein AJ80_06271 [Polytolypa hystricis UAMH7299]